MFVYEVNGKRIELPPASSASAGVVRRSRDLEPLQFLFAILESVASPEQLAMVDALSLDEMNRVLGLWMNGKDDAGVKVDASVGESSAS